MANYFNSVLYHCCKKEEHVLCIAYLDLPFSKENEDNSFFLIPAGTIGKGSEIKKSFGIEP